MTALDAGAISPAMAVPLDAPARPATVGLPALRNAVQALQGALAGRTTFPVLSHVWLRCFGDRLELVASDLETVVGAQIARLDPPPLALLVEGDDPLQWQQLVPGRLLADLLTRIGGGAGETARLVPVAPEVLRLSTRDGSAALVGGDVEAYPIGSPFDDRGDGAQMHVGAELLGDLIDQASIAAAGERDLERPLLANLRLLAPEWGESGEFGNGLRLEAADGYRLARAGYTMLRTQCDDPRLTETGVLVPARALRLLRPLLKREAIDPEDGRRIAGAAYLRLLPGARDTTPNLLEVVLPAGADGLQRLLLRSRLSSGQPPDWEHFFARTVPLSVTLDPAALLYHVKQAALFAPHGPGATTDHAPLSLTVDPTAPAGATVRLASRNPDGEHKAWLAADVSDVAAAGVAHTPITVGLSTGFLTGVLTTAPGKRLTIGLETGLLPVHFTAPDSPSEYHAVLMPMQGPTVAPDPGLPPPGEGPSRMVTPGESGLVTVP